MYAQITIRMLNGKKGILKETGSWLYIRPTSQRISGQRQSCLVVHNYLSRTTVLY